MSASVFGSRPTSTNEGNGSPQHRQSHVFVVVHRVSRAWQPVLGLLELTGDLGSRMGKKTTADESVEQPSHSVLHSTPKWRISEADQDSINALFQDYLDITCPFSTLSSNRLEMPSCCFKAAAWSGVHPSSSFSLGSAPFSSSIVVNTRGRGSSASATTSRYSCGAL